MFNKKIYKIWKKFNKTINKNKNREYNDIVKSRNIHFSPKRHSLVGIKILYFYYIDFSVDILYSLFSF